MVDNAGRELLLKVESRLMICAGPPAHGGARRFYRYRWLYSAMMSNGPYTDEGRRVLSGARDSRCAQRKDAYQGCYAFRC